MLALADRIFEGADLCSYTQDCSLGSEHISGVLHRIWLFAGDSYHKLELRVPDADVGPGAHMVAPWTKYSSCCRSLREIAEAAQVADHPTVEGQNVQEAEDLTESPDGDHP